MRIPSSAKTRDGTLKHILKKAVRGVIPDELIDRPKQGFGVPVYEWFFDRLGDDGAAGARRVLRGDRLPRPRRGERLVDAKPGAEVWYLLNFALWWKEYIAG